MLTPWDELVFEANPNCPPPSLLAVFGLSLIIMPLLEPVAVKGNPGDSGG